MTLSESFDIPVFWPLLLFYFVFIFFVTMRKQISHMMRYNYVPIDISKRQYGKDAKTGGK